MVQSARECTQTVMAISQKTISGRAMSLDVDGRQAENVRYK